MSVIYLTTGGKRDVDFRPVVAAAGIVPEQERPAYGDPDVASWGIQDAPALIYLHDSHAVHQVFDRTADKLATFDADAAAAVEAYEQAKADAGD